MSHSIVQKLAHGLARYRTIGVLGLLALSTAACTSDSSSSNSGTLQVLLTDAPFPFNDVSRVDLFVVRIDAKKGDATDADVARGAADNSTNENPDQDWVTVASPNQRLNLLDLRGGTTVNLGQKSLPTGTYAGFRIVINADSSTVTLKTGTVLKGNTNPGIVFPSAGRSGIKIKLSSPITVGSSGANSSIIVVDFDLANSFVLRGNSIAQNGLLFKPVVRATARDISSSISGTVRSGSATGPLVANATVEVLKSGTLVSDTSSANIVASTGTDAAGTFKAAFLPAGTYVLRAQLGTAAVLGATPVTLAQSQDVTGQLIIMP